MLDKEAMQRKIPLIHYELEVLVFSKISLF